MILIFLKKIKRFLTRNWAVILTILVLILGGLLHSVNMFKFPYYESDEGTYVSQAWTVNQEGLMTPYTYWYDHPPLGWYMISSWVDFLGGDWNAFGNSVNTGRVMMLVLHLIQLYIIMFIARRMTGNVWLSLLAGVLYTVSPIAVYFQRRVLLDNIMITWMLLSVSVFYFKKIRLTNIIASGLFFGFAVLSKVTAVMFGPPIIYQLLTGKFKIDIKFRVLGWLAAAGATVSLWILYAMVKTEFFINKTGDRVSLLGSLQYQAGRGKEVAFWHEGSSLMTNIETWLLMDHIFLYFLMGTILLALLIALFNKKYRFISLCALFYFYFLIRGGIVIGFYILALLPFAILVFIGFLDILNEWFREKSPLLNKIKIIALIVPLLALFIFHYPYRIKNYLQKDETSNQVAAVKWIKENLPEDAKILSDVYGLTDLLNPEYVNAKVFKNADWYFKVAKDPAIRFGKYKDDWRNFDYVFLSHEMVYQSEINHLPVVSDAIRNSRPLVKWTKGSTAYLDIQDLRSTNGDWAAIYKINGTTEAQLLFSWNYFKQNFWHSYGQIIDPQNGLTTSEGQAYAMLRAVFMNDKDSFLGLWFWTKDHLQFRIGDKLISWSWKDDKQLNSNNATDADLDIALSLIFAGKIFENGEYYNDALTLLDSIWEKTVVEINGRYYLLPMEKKIAERGNLYLLNPSYFSPAHYRVFASFDTNKDHNWTKLANDTYYVLNRINAMNTNNIENTPNWLTVNKQNGALNDASVYVQQGEANNFGFDSFRILFRVGLDREWFNTKESLDYLKKANIFWEKEWRNRGKFSAIYDLSGTPLVNYSSMSINAGILSSLGFTASGETTSLIYDNLFIDNLFIDEEKEIVYWGNGNNYYDNNWIWFGLALFNKNLPNLWSFNPE